MVILSKIKFTLFSIKQLAKFKQIIFKIYQQQHTSKTDKVLRSTNILRFVLYPWPFCTFKSWNFPLQKQIITLIFTCNLYSNYRL